MSLVELDGVRVTYPGGRRAALDGVSLAIGAGEMLGVVGASGSGKSTLAGVCLGLVRPREGELRFDGARLGRRRPHGLMQAVLQHPVWALNPRLRVGDSVAEPLTARARPPRDEVRQRVADMLRDVRLDPELADRLPHELSGGQRQRVSIARALVTQPRFIVFDEAVSALDVSVQAEILRLIRRLQEARRFGAMFISHDLPAVLDVADRVCVLRAGRVVETAPAAEFAAGPTDPYSRSLLEAS